MLPDNRGPGICSPDEAVPGFCGPSAGPFAGLFPGPGTGACAGSCPRQDAQPRTISASAMSPELNRRDMNDPTLSPPAVPIQVTKRRSDPTPCGKSRATRDGPGRPIALALSLQIPLLRTSMPDGTRGSPTPHPTPTKNGCTMAGALEPETRFPPKLGSDRPQVS